MADSVADWSPTGEQGADGWTYGYYNYTLDADKVYQQADFIEFPASTWNGTMYDLTSAASGPWTELGQTNVHPNGTNSVPGHEHWAIRRWTSSYAGPARISFRIATRSD